jgi:hypothetical protein
MEVSKAFTDKLVELGGDVKINTHDIKTVFKRIDEIRHMFWTILFIQIVQSALVIWKTIGR